MTEPAELNPQIAPTDQPPAGWSSLRVVADLAHPFTWALVGTIGVLMALSLGSAVTSLSAILVTIRVALFLALASTPRSAASKQGGLPGAGVSRSCVRSSPSWSAAP